MKPYIIVIYGKSSTGKDTLMQSILEERPFYHKTLRTTTRPQRRGEANDNYEFLDDSSKTFRYEMDDFIEHQFFRGWFYGTRKENLSENINIMTGSIEIVEELQTYHADEYNIFPVYLELDDKKRMIRALWREEKPDVHEICRRFVSETEQYERLKRLDNVGLVLNAERSVKDLTEKVLAGFNQYYMERLGVM